MPQRILYVVSRWNQETETFVRREVAAVVDVGVFVQVLSLRRPRASDGILREEVPVFQPTMWGLLTGLGAAVRHRPGAAAVGLWTILRHGRPRTWRPHLLAWLSAVSCWHRVERPDVVLAHFAWVSATAADQLSRLLDVPMAVFPHAHDIYEQRCVDHYLAVRLRRAVVVFVESGHIAEDVSRMFGVAAVVMRMGVPDDFLVERPKTVRPSSPLVASVGALRAKKGHDVLIRAVAGLGEVHLAIAGEGPERGHLEALITELHVADRVRLLGHQDPEEVRHLLDSSSLFALASRVTESGDRDGVPNVLIEAMARGVPCVSTTVSGIPDLLGDHRGYLVQPEDEAGLRASIRRVNADPADADRRARLALAHVREQYTTSGNIARLLEALAVGEESDE